MADKRPRVASGERRAARAAGALGLIVWMAASGSAEAAQSYERRFLAGVGQVIKGVVLEFPMTLIEATLNNPPVVGTIVGLFAGAAKAVQTTVGGLVEMSAGLRPAGSSPR
jgi:hypothetical protein